MFVAVLGFVLMRVFVSVDLLVDVVFAVLFNCVCVV